VGTPDGSAGAVSSGDGSAGDTVGFRVSPEALERVLEVRSAEEEPASLALRVAVVGVSGQDYRYDLAFEPVADADDDDHREIVPAGDDEPLIVLMPPDSVDKLRGAVLDVPSMAGQAGLVIKNPNRPSPLLDVGDLTLEGDLPEKIRQLLDEAINPSLAAHGGFASLVGVEGSTAYLTMGGGCQGCSLSQATMVQGIAAAITEAIPEVANVVDATDHSAGENPFYS